MQKKNIWIATKNKKKIKEFKALLPDYQIKSLLDLPMELVIEETGQTLEENALIKAKVLSTYLNEPAIGDDSGIFIKGLNNFPGVNSKRWAWPITDEQEINSLILKKMKDVNDRSAQMRTVLVYADPATKTENYFLGVIKGKISKEPRGKQVFGYDQIFELEDSKKTLSELGKNKNDYSHRQMAIYQLTEFLLKENVNDKEN